MEVVALSGATIAKLDEDALHGMVEQGYTIRDLKRFLANRIGYSRFRQRLFNGETKELADDMFLTPLPCVQLVLLDFGASDTTKELLKNCRQNRVHEVEKLLQWSQDPNQRCPVGDLSLVPIHVAALAGHMEVAQLLLEAGADKDAASNSGKTALYFAAGEGHMELVQLFLEAGADKDAAADTGATALIIAAANDHLEVVHVLLEAGADTEAAFGTGKTALVIAAEQGHLEVVQLLLQARADKEAAPDSGATALFMAAAKGYFEVVRVLLEAGADKDAAIVTGETASFIAAKQSHLE